MHRPPAYRRKSFRGQVKAVVTLADSDTRIRKDFWLGDFGSAESKERYARLIAEWESRGRRLPGDAGPGCSGLTVAELCLEYLIAAQQRYGASHLANLRTLIRVVVEMYGTAPAAEFGPNALRQVRASMVAGHAGDAGAKPRRPWSPSVANRFARYAVQVWKWGVAHELVAPGVWQALRALEPLRADQARPKVQPAPMPAVNATRPFLSAQVRAMVDLQLVTGMRPGEVCSMRPCDIEMGDVWTYRPRAHKTAHHGLDRVIHLGPRAQKIVKPFLKRATTAPLFSPQEAVEARIKVRAARRKTPASQGNGPGTNVAEKPKRPARSSYSRDSYGRAVRRACDQAEQNAQKSAKERHGAHARPAEARIVPRWSPNQLRHNYATEVRRRHGLEAAAILLGHATAHVTEAVYAQRDMDKARRVVREIG